MHRYALPWAAALVLVVSAWTAYEPWQPQHSEPGLGQSVQDSPPARPSADPTPIEMRSVAPPRQLEFYESRPDPQPAPDPVADDEVPVVFCGFRRTPRVLTIPDRVDGPTGAFRNTLLSIEGVPSHVDALAQQRGRVDVTLVDGFTGALVRTRVDASWLREDPQSWRWWYARHN